MNKRDYFIKALHAGAFKRRAWLNAVFAVVVREAANWEQDPFPYRTKTTEEGVFFVDPDKAPTMLGLAGTVNTEGYGLTKIEDGVPGEPLFGFLEAITIAPGEILNHTGDAPVRTTYGNCLVNHLVLAVPFGTTIPFVTGYFNIAGIERIIAERLIDNPEDDDGHSMAPEGKIYVRQYLQFADNAFFLKGLATHNVQSTSPKSLSHHPDRDKVRAAEMAKYTPEELKDPAIIARIGAVMEALDREWMAGDGAEQYYKSKDKKMFGSVRKRMHYMFGGESPFGDGTSVEFISKSLEEGIDTEHMTVMNNSLRYGSYSRGNQTQLGGETTKTIYRMLGTVRILEEDCGTRMGIPTKVTERNQRDLVGLWIVKDNGESELLTTENIAGFIGQVIRMRGPMVCKTGRNVTEGIAGKGKHICQRCAGVALSEQPGGMAAAAAGVGGRFLTLFLKKMHGSTLKTTRWNFKEHLH